MEKETPALYYTYINIRDSAEEQERSIECKQNKTMTYTWSILRTPFQSAVINLLPSR